MRTRLNVAEVKTFKYRH
uniref:Uncharacterized protein n=1 Tax=Anguilla anguilla TaxID=7936 RepID=A0A0E9PSE3_ANGAN